jgi:hypothetical protein
VDCQSSLVAPSLVPQHDIEILLDNVRDWSKYVVEQMICHGILKSAFHQLVP